MDQHLLLRRSSSDSPLLSRPDRWIQERALSALASEQFDMAKRRETQARGNNVKPMYFFGRQSYPLILKHGGPSSLFWGEASLSNLWGGVGKRRTSKRRERENRMMMTQTHEALFASFLPSFLLSRCSHLALFIIYLCIHRYMCHKAATRLNILGPKAPRHIKATWSASLSIFNSCSLLSLPLTFELTRDAQISRLGLG